MTLIRLVALTLLSAFLQGCHLSGESIITIANESGQPLREIEVEAGGRKLAYPNLESGTQVEFKVVPVKDSSIVVRFRHGDASSSATCIVDAYITTGLPSADHVVVNPDWQCLHVHDRN